MSLVQTYAIASSARSKLGREASYADHNLRRLVGHANLLDHLMVELADAERESENWLNQSIREAARPEEPRRVQWMDKIVEDYEEEDEEDESDDEEEIDDRELFSSALKIKQAPVLVSPVDYDSEEDAEYDEEEEEVELALRRVRSKQSPPELTIDDSDSESEDDYIPTSPGDSPLHLSEKERQAIATTAFYDLKSQQSIEDYMMQQQSQQPLIAAC